MENMMIKLLDNFDFAYMLIINVLTYIIIELFNKKKKLTTWCKRLVLVISILIVTAIYKIIGYENNIILINSVILAPVSWTWIFKPIVKYFKNRNNE